MERSTITAAKRLQFAIRFAQMNLDALRPGDWLNLRDDLAIFLGCKSGHGYTIEDKGGIATAPLAHPLPQEFSEEDFRALQKDVEVIVNSLVHEGMLSTQAIEIHAYYSLFNSSRANFHVLIAHGATRDMFLLTLFFLLNQEPLDRIKRCPECHVIFYRIRKQQYCARACTNRATVRAWRQREDVKTEEQERAHQHYAKKKKLAVGQGVSISRKPRKARTESAETQGPP